MEELELEEARRQQLDGIVSKMVANKEADEDIQFVVNDFKKKYGVQKKSPNQSNPPAGGAGLGARSVPQSERSKSTTPTESNTGAIKTPYQIEQEKRDREYKKLEAQGPIGVMQSNFKHLVNFTSDLYEQGKDAVVNQIAPAVQSSLASVATPELLNNPTPFIPKGVNKPAEHTYTKADVEKMRQDAVAFQNKRSKESAQKPFIRQYKEINNAGDATNYVFGVISSQIPQIAGALGSGGIMSILQETGNNYASQVNAIAEKEGITPDEVIRQKKDNPALAVTFGTAQGLLDKVGAGKLVGLVKNSSLKKKALDILVEWGTELAQEQLGKTQTGIATDTPISETGLTWPEIGEITAQTAILGGAGSAASRLNSSASETTTPTNPPTTANKEPDTSADTQSGQIIPDQGTYEWLKDADPEWLSVRYEGAKLQNNAPEMLAIEQIAQERNIKIDAIQKNTTQEGGVDSGIANDPKSGSKEVVSFETAKGSIYTYGPDGKTSRFKTVENKQSDPQELIVFADLSFSEEQDFLSAIHNKGMFAGSKVYVIDKEGNKIRTNAEAKGKELALAIVKDGKILQTKRITATPTVGYNTFDTRRYTEGGKSFTERHLGNKVTKINYNSSANGSQDSNSVNSPNQSAGEPVSDGTTIRNESTGEVSGSVEPTAESVANDVNSGDSINDSADGGVKTNPGQQRLGENKLLVARSEETKANVERAIPIIEKALAEGYNPLTGIRGLSSKAIVKNALADLKSGVESKSVKTLLDALDNEIDGGRVLIDETATPSVSEYLDELESGGIDVDEKVAKQIDDFLSDIPEISEGHLYNLLTLTPNSPVFDTLGDQAKSSLVATLKQRINERAITEETAIATNGGETLDQGGSNELNQDGATPRPDDAEVQQEITPPKPPTASAATSNSSDDSLQERGLSQQLRTKANVPKLTSEAIKANPLMYRRLANNEVLDQANAEIEEAIKTDEGYQKLYREVASSAESVNSGTALMNTKAMLLIHILDTSAQNESDPNIKQDLLNEAESIVNALAERLTKAGQASQVASLFNQMTPSLIINGFNKARGRFAETKAGVARIKRARKTASRVATEINENKEKAVKEAIDKVLPPRAKRTSESKEVIKARIDKNAALAKEAVKKLFERGNFGFSGPPINPEATQQLFDITKELVKDYIRLGVTNAKEIYRKIASDIGLPENKVEDFVIWADEQGVYEAMSKKTKPEPKTAEGIIRKQLRVDGTSLRQLVEDHYAGKDTARTLREKLVQDLDVSQTDASAYATEIEETIARLIKTTNEKVVANWVKPRTPKQKKKVVDIAEKIADMVTRGVLSEEDVMNLEGFQKKFGIPEALTPEAVAELTRLSELVKKAPEGLLRDRYSDQLNRFMASQFPANKWDAYWALYYPANLSGLTTQFMNFNDGVLGLLSEEIISKAARDPKEFAFAVELLFRNEKGGLREGLKEGKVNFRDIMQFGSDGSNKFSDVKKDSKFRNQATIEDYAKMKPETVLQHVFYPLYNLYKYVNRFMSAVDALAYYGYQGGETMGLIRDKYINEGKTGKELRTAVLEELYGTQAVQMAALEQAKKEISELGITGKRAELDTKRRVYEILRQKLDKDVQQRAEDYAKDNTYKSPPKGMAGVLAKTINTLLQTIPASKFIFGVDFVNISFNIANRYANYTPLGYLRAFGWSPSNWPITMHKLEAINIEPTMMGEAGTRERARQVANASVGTVFMLAAVALAVSGLGEDNDEGVMGFDITGSAPANIAKAKTGARVRPWNSFKIKGVWYNYQNIRPLAWALSVAGNIKDRLRNGDDPKEVYNMANFQMLLMYNANPKVLLDATPLANIERNFRQSTSQKEGETNAEWFWNVMKNQASRGISAATAPVMPNIIKQGIRAIDPTVYSPKTVNGILAKSAGVIQFVGNEEYVWDAFGRKQKMYPGEQFLPIQHWTGELGNDPVDKLVFGELELAKQPPAATSAFWVNNPDYNASDPESPMYIKAQIGEYKEIYRQYIEQSGKAAYERIANDIKNGSMPTQGDPRFKNRSEWKKAVTKGINAVFREERERVLNELNSKHLGLN